MYAMRILITVIMLVICSVSDMKTGYIGTKTIVISTLLGIVLRTTDFIQELRYIKGISFYAVIIKLLLLLILFVFFLKKENTYISRWIGEGDILIFISICLINGTQFLISTLFIAFVFSGIYALYLRFVKRLENTTTFAFLPFVLSGCLITVIKWTL